MMLKNIQEILDFIVKEASKAKEKLKNLKIKGQSKITSEIVASSELTDFENYRDIVKLKKSYERLMNKFVNPRLNIISQSINIHDKCKYLPNVPNQDNLHSKIVEVVLQRKQKGQPLLPTTVQDSAPSNFLLGWSGQPLNKQSIDPQPELSTKPHDIAAAFFIFPELVGESNDGIVAKNCCCKLISEINPKKEKDCKKLTVSKSSKSAQLIKDNPKFNLSPTELKVGGEMEKNQDKHCGMISSHTVYKIESKGESLQDIDLEYITKLNNATVLNRNWEVKLIALDVNESPTNISKENIDMTSNKLLFNTISVPENKMLSSTTAKTDNTTCEVLQIEKGEEKQIKKKLEHLIPLQCSNLITPTPYQLHSSNICTEEINNLSIKSKSNIALDGSVCTKSNSPEEPTQGMNSSVKIKKGFHSHISNSVNVMDSQNKTLEDSPPIKLDLSGENPTQDTKPVQNNSHFETHLSIRPSVKDLDGNSITSKKIYMSENMTRTSLMNTEKCISNVNELMKEDKQTNLNTQISSPFSVKIDKDLYKNYTKETATTKKDISTNSCVPKIRIVDQNLEPIIRNKHCKPPMKNKKAYWISVSANSKLTRQKTNVIDIITACSTNFLNCNKDELISSSNKCKLITGKEVELNNHTLTNDVHNLIKPQLHIGQKNKMKYPNISKPQEKSLENNVKKCNSNTHSQVHEKRNDNLHTQTNKPVSNDKSNNYTAHHSDEDLKSKTILIDDEASNMPIKPSLGKNSTTHSESTVINMKSNNISIKGTRKYQNSSYKSVRNKLHFNPYLNKLSYKSPSNNCLFRPQYKVDDRNSGHLYGNDIIGIENSKNIKFGRPIQNKQPKLVIKTRESLKNGRHKKCLVNRPKLSSRKIKKSGKRYLIKGSLVKLDGMANDGKQDKPSYQSDREHSSPKQISNQNNWTIVNNYNKTLIKKTNNMTPGYNAESVLNNNTNLKTNAQENLLLEKNCNIKDLQSPEETYNFKKQLICNESLPIYNFVSKKRFLINDNKPDNFIRYNNSETSRKLHSKKTSLKIFNLKMYGSVKNKAGDSLSDVTEPKGIPESCKMEHNTKIDKTHSSSLSTGNSCFQNNKQHANEVKNEVFPVRIQSRNFSIHHKVNIFLNYVVKRYATTLISCNTKYSPEYTGNNKLCQLGASDNVNFTVFQKKLVRDSDLKGAKNTSINNQKNKCPISNCDNDIIDENKINSKSIIVKNQTKVNNINSVKIPYDKNINCQKFKLWNTVPKRRSYSFEEIYNTKSIKKEIDNGNNLKLNIKPQPPTPIYRYRESKSETAFLTKNKCVDSSFKERNRIITKPQSYKTDLINKRQINLKNCKNNNEFEKNKIVKNTYFPYRWENSDRYNKNSLNIVSQNVKNEHNDSTPNNIYNQKSDADIPSCTDKLLKANTTIQTKSQSIISKKICVTQNGDNKFKKDEREENNPFLLKEDEPKHEKWKSKTDRLNDWTLQVNKYECKSYKRTLIKTHSKQRNAAITTPAVINDNITNIGKKCMINSNPDTVTKIKNVYRPYEKNCAIDQSDLKINKTNNHCKIKMSKEPLKSSLFVKPSPEMLVKQETNGSIDKKMANSYENQNKANAYSSDNYKNHSNYNQNKINYNQNIGGSKESVKKIELSVTSTKQINPNQLNRLIVTKNQENEGLKFKKDLPKKNKLESSFYILDKSLKKVRNNGNEGNSTFNNRSNTLGNTPFIAQHNGIGNYSKTNITVVRVDSKKNNSDSNNNSRNNKNNITKAIPKINLIITDSSTDCKEINRTIKSKVYPLQSDLKVKEKALPKPEDTTIKKERLNYDCDTSSIKTVTGLKKNIPLNVTGIETNKKLIAKKKCSIADAPQLPKYDNGFSTRMIGDVSNQKNKKVSKGLLFNKSSIENIFNEMKSHEQTSFKIKAVIKTSSKDKTHQNIQLKTKNIISGKTANVLSTVLNASARGKNKLKDSNSIDNFKQHLNNTIDNNFNSCNRTIHERFLSGTTSAKSATTPSISKTNKEQKCDSLKKNINIISNNTTSMQSPIKTNPLQEPDINQNCASETLFVTKKKEKERRKFNSTKVVDNIWKPKSSKENVKILVHPIEKEQQYINFPPMLNLSSATIKNISKQNIKKSTSVN